MKTNEQIDELIRENLYSFYHRIGEASGGESGFNGSVNFIKSPGMSWPSFILGGGEISENNLRLTIGAITEGNLPFLWIKPEKDFAGFEENAAEYGIRKVNFWKGMYLNRKSMFHLPCPIPGLRFEEIKSGEELEKWLAVVNLELSSHRAYTMKSFLKTLNDPSFRLFRVCDGVKTISTALTYSRSSETGIYMVSTIVSQRGKGIGSWITASAIDKAIFEGCNDFILHATPSGYPVYSKLGFNEYSGYNIFWKLGMK
jgi:hypothetical protein